MQLNPRYGDEPVLNVDSAVIESTVADPATTMVQQRARMASRLAELDARQWATPSRCDGWTVKDVIAHLVGTNQFWTISLASALAGEPTRYLTGFDPVATPPSMVEGLRSLSPAETLEHFARTSDELSATVTGLDPTTWEILAEAPPGHVPIAVVLLHALWDSWIHERDVLLPLDIHPVEDSREVAGSLLYAAALSPTFLAVGGSTRQGTTVVRARRPEVRFTIDVGPTVTVHDGPGSDGALVLAGDAVELAEALSFRAPLDHAVPDSLRWQLAGLAEVFDVDGSR